MNSMVDEWRLCNGGEAAANRSAYCHADIEHTGEQREACEGGSARRWQTNGGRDGVNNKMKSW